MAALCLPMSCVKKWKSLRKKLTILKTTAFIANFNMKNNNVNHRTMKKSRLIILLLSLAMLQIACEKNIPTGPEVKNLRELDVPEDFLWSNAHRAGLTVNLQNADGIETEGRVIQLLDTESRVIQVARVSNNTAQFSAEVPADIDKLTVFLPMTRTRLDVDNIAGLKTMTMDLGGLGAPEGTSFKFEGTANCDDNCDRTISEKVSYLQVDKGETVCLTGVLDGGLSIADGGTLRICGTATVQWTDIKTRNSATIIVSKEGTLESSSFYFSGAEHYLVNFGSITLKNWLDIKGKTENYGEISVNGLGISSSGILDNYGFFTVDGTVDLTGKLTNYEGGTFRNDVDQDSFNLSWGGTLDNRCKLYIGDNFNLGSGYVYNSGYLRINGWFYGNTKYDVVLGNQSMIHANNFQPNCPLVCKDGGASILVDDATNIDKSTTFTGWIDICDENGIDNIWTRSGELPENVTFCEIYVPVNGCNPVGIGKPQVQDADGDGIVDDEDDFPADPTRAFSVMEPYAGYKIWAFEDLWPSTGDYDFNDLVIATRMEYILNADMLPVEAEGEVEVRAIGAGLKNGLALQFLSESLPDAQIIEAVEGENITIDETANNCIILANDVMGRLSPQYNNNGVGPKGEPEVWSFKITFNPEAVNNNMLSSDFFIFRTNDRSHEVHVAGNPATSTANSSLFGTGEDESNPGTGYWYKTYNGIPWGITLLTVDHDWNHPIEKISILEAYPAFETWATSGGAANSDWYLKGLYDKCFHR